MALLPGSALAASELAGIAAGEALLQLGLDLPPLRLQQLRSAAAGGDSAPLELLLAEHPHLATADVSVLQQVSETLGAGQQQQPLMLKAAAVALDAGSVGKALALLLPLASQQYK